MVRLSQALLATSQQEDRYLSSYRVIKKSTAKHKKSKLIELLDKFKDSNHLNDKLESRIFSHVKGYDGESNAAFHLNYLDDSFYIIHNIKLAIDDISAQIDHLIISTKGFFLVETKNWSQNIVIKGEYWYAENKSGSLVGRENPFNQMFRHQQVINRHLKNSELFNKLNISIEDIPFIEIVALAEIKSLVSQKADNSSRQHVVKVDGVAKKIIKVSNELPEVFSPEEVMLISEYLLSKDRAVFESIKLKNEATLRSPEDFIKNIDSAWEESVEILMNGKLYNNLKNIDDLPGQLTLDYAFKKYADPNMALEWIAQNNPWLPLSSPTLFIEPTEIIIDNAKHGETVSTKLTLKNTGRGLLYTFVSVDGQDDFILSNSATHVINVPTAKMPLATRTIKKTVDVVSNGGAASIPVTINFAIPWREFIRPVLQYSTIFSVVFMLGFYLQQYLIENSVRFSTPVAIFFSILCTIVFAIRLRDSFSIPLILSFILSLVITPLLLILFNFSEIFLSIFYYSISFGSINVATGLPTNMILIILGSILFGSLTGILFKALPLAFTTLGFNKFRYAPIAAGILLLLTINFIGSQSSNSFNKLLASSIEADLTQSEEITQTVEFNVQMVFQEDVGPEIFFLNEQDMATLGIEDNQVITLESSTQSLSLPARSHSRVDPGVLRVQQSVRDKLKVSRGDLVRYNYLVD